MRIVSFAGAIGVTMSAALCSGCLTFGVIQRSAGRTDRDARITEVRQSATLGHDLFLRLGVQSHKHPETRMVVLRVPFDEIGRLPFNEKGEPQPSAGAVRLEVDELLFQPPGVGYWVPDGEIPTGSSPVQAEYVEFGWDSLETRLAALPSGIHVLIVLDIDSYREQLAGPVLRNGAVPAGAHVVLARRVEVNEPETSHLWSFNEARKKNRAWLLLTPLTVAGDIATCPFQLLYALIMLGD
jgi:hypothetical protein